MQQQERNNQGSLIGNVLGNFFGGQQVGANKMSQGQLGPIQQPREYYQDDFAFCSNFDDKNIVITGATGTIGS